MPRPEPTMELTPEQIEHYHTEGYLRLDAITTPEEVEQIRQWYDEAFRNRAGRDAGDQFDLAGTDEEGKEASLPQILAPEKYMPQLGETLALANADRIAKQLYGDDAVASSAHCIFKPARTGAETPWHQDESYWSGAHAYRTGSIWIPLQEASVENGCMWFVPRSHELDVVPHQSINNDPRVHGLELRADQMHLVKDAEPQPLPPGGATIHGSRMLHYAGPNRSDVPRRAYIISIAAPARLRETPRLFPWLEEKRTARMERMGVGRGDAADDVASKPAG